MKIVLGADHRGFEQKKHVIAQLSQNNTITCIDVGTNTTERTDYPLYADAVVESMLQGSADVGILFCGSGAGIAIAANRYKGIYAGVAWCKEVARHMKEDANINVLVIPSDFVTNDEVTGIVAAWLGARFKGGRYEQRLQMIDKE